MKPLHKDFLEELLIALSGSRYHIDLGGARTPEGLKVQLPPNMVFSVPMLKLYAEASKPPPGASACDYNPIVLMRFEPLVAEMPLKPTDKIILAMHAALWEGGGEIDPTGVEYAHLEQVYRAILEAAR